MLNMDPQMACDEVRKKGFKILIYDYRHGTTCV
jgi:hypothetical protein